jgi:hypothetical protein
MQPNEMIEHDIINSSINRTQEKVAGKVSIENAANNQTDWLFKNMK